MKEKSIILHAVIVAASIYGAGYCLYVIVNCFLLCSAPALMFSGITAIIGILMFFLSPILTIVGAILLGLKRKTGPILLMVASLGIVFGYGFSQIDVMLNAAIPVFTSGALGMVMLISREHQS